MYIAANIAGKYTQSLAHPPNVTDNSKKMGFASEFVLSAASAPRHPLRGILSAASADRVTLLMRARSRVAGAGERAGGAGELEGGAGAGAGVGELEGGAAMVAAVVDQAT